MSKKYTRVWNIKPECDGALEAAFAAMEKPPDCICWNNITSKMIDKKPEDGSVGSGVCYNAGSFLPQMMLQLQENMVWQRLFLL